MLNTPALPSRNIGVNYWPILAVDVNNSRKVACSGSGIVNPRPPLSSPIPYIKMSRIRHIFKRYVSPHRHNVARSLVAQLVCVHTARLDSIRRHPSSSSMLSPARTTARPEFHDSRPTRTTLLETDRKFETGGVYVSQPLDWMSKKLSKGSTLNHFLSTHTLPIDSRSKRST